MYAPTPKRPKKTNICRSRAGCSSCRQRRKKCDELKPSCGSCMRLGRRCEQISPSFEFRSVEIRPTQNGRPQTKPRKRRTASPMDITTVVENRSQRQGTPLYMKTVPDISAKSPCSVGSLSDDSSTGTGEALSSIDWNDIDFNFSLETESDLNFDSRAAKWNLSNSSSGATQLDLELAGRNYKRIAPTLMAAHDYSQAIAFYMDIWRHHCLPALHLSFQNIEVLCGKSQLITDTMATLSACRLSRTLPQRRLFKTSRASDLSFRPDSGHECLSGELYGSAMRQMSWWSHKELDSNPTVALAVLVLFCYLESSMGNFKEFQVHSKAVEKLLVSYSDHVMSTGLDLLAAWVEVKMQNWWRRAHFGVPTFYRDWSIPLLNPILETMTTTAAYRRASVLWILCESHRLSTAAIIECSEKRCNNQVPRYDRALDFEDVTGVAMEYQTLENELAVLMRAQSGRLDTWYTSLQSHELPEVMQDPKLWSAISMKNPEDSAIRFRSHELAMNFAYYVTARVMLCSELLQRSDNNSLANVGDPYEEMEIWIQLLLRIATGISWNDCIRLNVYTIGFAGLLLACALRSRNIATGIWVQEWLEENLKENGFEEGNFPVFQIVSALKVINRERKNGRDVIALFQTVDDEGGSGKFGSYSSQLIQSFLAYARCNETGNVYSYQVSLGDSKP